MSQRGIMMAAGGMLTCLVLAPVAAQDKQGNLSSTTPMVKWDLKVLNQEPFKLIRATPDPKKGSVCFLIEFSRIPTSNEIFDWEKGDGMAVFRFQDEDGVTIKSVKTKIEGEIIQKPGTRIRLLLPMPDAKTQEATWKIVAD
jgi:hypothetical protein